MTVNIKMENNIDNNEENQNKLGVQKNGVGKFLGFGFVVLLIAVFAYFTFGKKTTSNEFALVGNVQQNPSTEMPAMMEIKNISLAEISAHSSSADCWTAINGEVFDVTGFISKHKGGDKILSACGIDATDLFTGKSTLGRVHSQLATKLLSSMKIGNLVN
jgi:cytochrome b involved in lipid metabolism